MREPEDYEKCSVDSEDYYGLFRVAHESRESRIKIDPVRMEEMGILDEEIIKNINSKPRNNEYYMPTQRHRGDYMVNRFRDTTKFLRENWHQEFSMAIKAIKTPEEAGDNARTDALMDGVLEHEEACIVGIMESFRRKKKYDFVIASIYAQYIHFIGSLIESTMLQVLIAKEYPHTVFNRDLALKFINKSFAKDVSEITSYELYERFYRLWNFLKHNSQDTYDRLKKSWPEIVADKYKHGDFALKYVKIHNKIIDELLDGLEAFFKEFCKEVFGEAVEEAWWDYDEFFIEQVNSMIEDFTNPYGLPDYL